MLYSRCLPQGSLRYNDFLDANGLAMDKLRSGILVGAETEERISLVACDVSKLISGSLKVSSSDFVKISVREFIKMNVASLTPQVPFAFWGMRDSSAFSGTI